MSLVALVACLTLQSPLVPVARVEHPPIDEMSGIVKSRRWAGVYWVHNDSGDQARVFAIRADGSAVMPGQQNRKEDAGKVEPVPPEFPGLAINQAVNTDWEDIAYDGQNLYLADVGNNNNARRDLAVYVVSEPNPFDARSATPTTRYPVAYLDQADFPPAGDKPFDCEAVFARGGNLYFLTKHRSPVGMPVGATNLYVLSLRSARADRVNVLRKVASLQGLPGWVTAADVSDDGRRLAILMQAPGQAVWTFDLEGPESGWLRKPSAKVEFSGARQCEAICWDGPDTVRITNEQRDVFTLRVG